MQEEKQLTIVQMLPDLDEGGVEAETVETAAYLSKNGHRSMVISAGGRMVSALEKAGSRHVSWRYIGEKSPRCLTYLIPLRRLLIREQVDVLHLRSRLPAWIGFLAWKSLPSEKRPRLLTTFHGFYSVNAYSAIMTRGEQVMAVSKTIAKHITTAYGTPKEKITIIYGGFDETLFDPEKVDAARTDRLKTSWGLDTGATPLILLPGRITRLKGHEMFIQSLKQIRHIPWTAVCAGDTRENADLVEELRDRARAANLEDRIKFVGHCDDMPAAMLLADVVVSASIKPESFGKTAVESQAMGTPVIATAHGGSLETVVNRETGWLVQPGDDISMADALQEAITDRPISRRLGEQGKKRVSERFTSAIMLEKTVAVYQALARKSRTQQAGR